MRRSWPDGFEEKFYLRTRARRPADRKSREDLVQAMVVNLAHSALSPLPSGRLAIRAGNAAKGATRYDHPACGKGVRPLLAIMHETGLLDFQPPIAMRVRCRSRWLARPFAHVRLRKGTRTTELAHLFNAESAGWKRLQDRLRGDRRIEPRGPVLAIENSNLPIMIGRDVGARRHR
jgi:hypothetical protein